MDFTGAVAFDREGYLWVGTQEGAARFDGRTWTRLSMPRPERSNWPLCILGASDGSLWFGTYGDGLHRYHEGKWTSFTPESGFPDGRVNVLAEAPGPSGGSVVWAGTHGHGVWGVTLGGKVVEGGPTLGRVLALTRDAEGLWAGTEQGLYKRESGAWIRFHRGNSGLPSDTVFSLAAAQGGLWIGTAEGLARMEGNRWRIWRAGLKHPAVKQLVVLPGGGLWAGTDMGLARFDGEGFTVFGAGAGLPNDVIQALGAGPAGGGPQCLWAATSGGLAQVNLGRWVSFRAGLGALPEKNVFAILETEEAGAGDAIWFGTYGGGLARWSGGTWSTLNRVGGRPLTAVRSLAEIRESDGSKALWVGTFRQGLFRLWRKRWEQVPVPPALARAEWRQFLEMDGQVWAATSEGLARRDGSRWTVWTTADGLPHHDVMRLLATRDVAGRPILWAATSRGVGRWTGGRWTRIGPEEGLGAPWVMDLFPWHDPQGRPQIWAATAGGGVWTLDPEGHPGRAEGPVPSNGTVYGFQRDRRGRLYLFTTRGVARLTPGAGEPEWFNTADGLPHNDCNQGASLVDRRGRIWVGTVGGAAALDPEAALPDRTPKPFLLAASRPPEGRPLVRGARLGYRDNHVRFDLKLLAFHRGAESQFQTQLVGLESAPSPWTSDPAVEFPRLPPGEYVFQAWARDAAGNPAGPIVFPFSLRPAPWLTLWAFGAYSVLGLAAFVGCLRLRTHFLDRRNRELEARIQEATRELAALNEEKNEFIALAAHDLKNPLSLIQQLSEGLLRGEIAGSTESSRPWLQMVSQAARDMSALVHRVLNVSAIESGGLEPKFESVDVAALAAETVQAFFARAERKGLHLDVEGLPEVLWARTDGPYLQEVIQNLLSNAIKFSPPGGTVWIRGRMQGRRAVLEVQDQGPGLTEEDKARLFQRFAQLSARPTGDESSCGLGLSIAKRLVEALQGWVHVESEAGKGATFRVELPAA